MVLPARCRVLVHRAWAATVVTRAVAALVALVARLFWPATMVAAAALAAMLERLALVARVL